MQVRFLQNLGSVDAAECNKATGASVDFRECKIGAVVEIPDAAAKWFSGKFAALFETVEKVKGEAKAPAVTGAKQ